MAFNIRRKCGETIVIGGETVVKINRVGTSTVTLTVDAPRYIRIARGEEVDKLDQSDRLAISEREIATLIDLLTAVRVDKTESTRINATIQAQRLLRRIADRGESPKVRLEI